MIEDVLVATAALAAIISTIALVRQGRRRPGSLLPAVGTAVLATAAVALAVATIGGGTPLLSSLVHLSAGVLAVPVLAVESARQAGGRWAAAAAALLVGLLGTAVAVAAVGTGVWQSGDAGMVADPMVPVLVVPGLIGPVPAAAAAVVGAGGVLMMCFVTIAVRSRREDGRAVLANGLIALAAGTTAGGYWSWRLSDDASSPVLAIALLAATMLVWLSARATSARRPPPAPLPTVTLAGPSIENPERAHVEVMIAALERAGYRVICPARDIEDWGNVGYPPDEATRRTCRAIDQSGAVVVDLHHGYGVVSAGYAYAKDVPIIMAAPEGTRIARPLRGVATAEVYYRSVDDVVDRLVEILPPGIVLSPEPEPEPVSTAGARRNP